MSQNYTANATSATLAWPGGEGEFWAAGTGGGGTLTLKRSDGTTIVPIGTGSNLAAMTDSGSIRFAAAKCTLSFVLTGATNPNIVFNVERFQGISGT